MSQFKDPRITISTPGFQAVSTYLNHLFGKKIINFPANIVGSHEPGYDFRRNEDIDWQANSTYSSVLYFILLLRWDANFLSYLTFFSFCLRKAQST